MFESCETPSERLLRQHDVRDFIGLGHNVKDIASWIEAEFGGVRVTPLVNVLEIRAPAETQLRVESFLETKRRIGSGVLRVYDVADLTTQCRGLDPEIFPPFEIDNLCEVIAKVSRNHVWIVFRDVKRSDWAMDGKLLG